VWPAPLRITHWLMALAVMVVLVTGWLLRSGLILNDRLYQLLLDDFHLPAGHLLAMALVVRLYYLVTDEGVGGVAALLPRVRLAADYLALFRFYASLGRLPLPAWYAHNPLWAPLYLLIFLLLLGAVVTGLLLQYAGLRGLFGLSSEPLLYWHDWPLAGLTLLALGHVLSTFLQDLRGKGCDVSAMINGYRHFEVGSPAAIPPRTADPAVSVQDIGGRRGKPDSGDKSR